MKLRMEAIYGKLMSDLSNTPYRSYKKWCFQGGTSSPLIISYGDVEKNKRKGEITHQYAHIIDILPTCMGLGQVYYPNQYAHKDLPGVNLMPALYRNQLLERTLYFEHQGSSAIIDGDWKLVRANRHVAWELINLKDDPFELHDLAKQFPEKVEELETKWISWGSTHKVFPLEDKSWTPRLEFYKAKNPDQRGEY